MLRFFAFLFNLALGLCLFLLTLLVISTGIHNIQLAPVPLERSTLTYTLLIASIGSFVGMVLALRQGRATKFPMLFWNLLIVALLLWTPLRSSFSFAGPDQARQGFYIFLASLLALWGSWLQWRSGGR
ncbi:MAG: hypothetical protein HY236_10320 [Acidobacteria bacterium]|nr:hypothetical protein [Acidobacteriota bacterium]